MTVNAVRRVAISGLVALLALRSGSAGAQHGTLRAVIVDSTGRPVQGAEVSIFAQARRSRSDSLGRVQFDALQLGTVELSVRRLGYHANTKTALVSGAPRDSVMVILATEITSLDQVDVNAIGAHPFFKGFEQRRAQGIGTFLTKEQIESQNTSTPSDLFRMVPQVVLVKVSGGLGIRFPSGRTSIRSGPMSMCQPMIWVDGQRAPGLEIDDLRKDDIVAVELYRGVSVTPPQFATGGVTQCGAVVVWTRRKG